MSDFYSRYVNLCAQKRKSLSGVAEDIGLSRTAPNGWKKGKLPNDTTLSKLSVYFGVSVEYLKNGEEGKKEAPPVFTEDAMRGLLNDMSAEQLIDIIAKATAKLKERGAK